MSKNKSDAAVAGGTAAALSIVVTLGVMLLIRPPWGLLTVLLGVGIATYASAYAVAAAS